MRYVSEYRDKNLVRQTVVNIESILGRSGARFMEVCGTHTHNFLRFGLNRLIPPNLQLISGPGCPVCVSTREYIDKAISYAALKDAIILTYGDMLKVPGSNSSLEKERAKGAQIKVLYSALDSLTIARENPNKKIVFLGVGFETTAPTVALTLLAAKKEKIDNLFFFSSLKLIPPAMAHLLKDKKLNIQGFLCPGHVSTIIGTQAYEFIARRFKIGCCVAGFEPLDILQGLQMLLRQLRDKRPRVDNQYQRVVREKGNSKAKGIIFKVFEPVVAAWRGLGEIPKSGLKIKKEFSLFDAEKAFPLSHTQYLPAGRHGAISYKQTKCRCAEVLKGLIIPKQCPMFSKVCKPDNPLGACMVSREGACNAYYKYR